MQNYSLVKLLDNALMNFYVTHVVTSQPLTLNINNLKILGS